MNWDRIEGNWKQFKGNIKQQWGRLADDQLAVIAGKRDQQAGNAQESHGISKDEAKKTACRMARASERNGIFQVTERGGECPRLCITAQFTTSKEQQ